MTYPHTVNLPYNRSSIRGLYAPPGPGEQLSRAPGYWIIMHGDTIILDDGAPERVLHAGELADLVEMERVGKTLAMGTWRGKPLRLALMDGEGDLPASLRAEPLLTLSFAGNLSDASLTVAGMAQQLGLWEKKSVFCPRCGGETTRIPGLWGKLCASCRYEHFPSIYPCTLVLVRRGDEVLLVRKREWPPSYFSLPSGFCDMGECLEECAEREVLEETGVSISNLTYVGSQCWPFPSQLMTGFSADYEGGELVPDLTELEDARWFRCDALPPTFSSTSIAGWIIERHLAAYRMNL